MTNRESLNELEAAIQSLDARLQPIANRPIGITVLAWVKRLGSIDPLVEAGIRRDEAQGLLLKIIDNYQQATSEERQQIRDLFGRYRAFAWATQLPHRPTTEATFRQHLLLFSIDDQGKDSRDAILLLHDLCDEAVRAGVNIKPILGEVAMLSSDVDKYGMGSTRKLLRSAG